MRLSAWGSFKPAINLFVVGIILMIDGGILRKHSRAIHLLITLIIIPLLRKVHYVHYLPTAHFGLTSDNFIGGISLWSIQIIHDFIIESDLLLLLIILLISIDSMIIYIASFQ